MAAQPWPPGIDQCWMLAGFSMQNEPVVIRSSVDAGIDKVRRRFTKPVVLIGATIKATKIELNTFLNFFDNTLQGGALRFSSTDPITDAVEEYRFINPASITPIDATYFLISMQLERL